MSSKLAFGHANEKKAEQFLKKQGHKIVARNFRSKQGEIDIVSTLGRTLLVFTEVRSKHDTSYGHPVETIDTNKQRKIRETAALFLHQHTTYQNYQCRFDVVTIVGEGKQAVLEYFENAF